MNIEQIASIIVILFFFGLFLYAAKRINREADNL